MRSLIGWLLRVIGEPKKAGTNECYHVSERPPDPPAMGGRMVTFPVMENYRGYLNGKIDAATYSRRCARAVHEYF